MSDGRCTFCDLEPDRVFFETELVIGRWGRYRVSPSHATPSRKLHDPDGFSIGIDIGPAAAEKMKLNAEKYPADLARGTVLKYSKLK